MAHPRTHADPRHTALRAPGKHPYSLGGYNRPAWAVGAKLSALSPLSTLRGLEVTTPNAAFVPKGTGHALTVRSPLPVPAFLGGATTHEGRAKNRSRTPHRPLNPAWAQATVRVGLVDGLSSLRFALSSPTPTGTDQREPLSPHRTGSLK